MVLLTRTEDLSARQAAFAESQANDRRARAVRLHDRKSSLSVRWLRANGRMLLALADRIEKDR